MLLHNCLQSEIMHRINHILTNLSNSFVLKVHDSLIGNTTWAVLQLVHLFIHEVVVLGPLARWETFPFHYCIVKERQRLKCP